VNRSQMLIMGVPLAAAALFAAVTLLPHHTQPPPLAPAAQIIVTDHGCILQSGDSVSVSVAHNTLIGFAYLHHTGFFEQYTAQFSSRPIVRPYYYLRFHSAQPWGVWVSRAQFTKPVLRINCLGGRMGNIAQPPWANDPFPDVAFPIDN
jgi:hypothetical protein